MRYEIARNHILPQFSYAVRLYAISRSPGFGTAVGHVIVAAPNYQELFG